MVFSNFPRSVDEIDPRRWETFAPYFEALLEWEPDSSGIREWLEDWSRLLKLYDEAGAMIYVEKSLDTADAEKEQAF